jgi:ABC-type lipoprotein export system ATPase subunit
MSYQQMNRSTLRTDSIYKIFKNITILNNVTSEFVRGNTYAITGISGSGKSTFMHILAGLDTPTRGTIYFTNISLQAMHSSTLAQFLNKSIGLVFQSSYLMRELSVIENIILPGLINGQTINDCKKKAEKLLDTVKLSFCKNSKIGELSGGQQQRIAIARALFNEPEFLIADEPTGNLDLATGETIIKLLLACQREWGMGIIISSHDEYVTRAMNEVWELREGKLYAHPKNNP